MALSQGPFITSFGVAWVTTALPHAVSSQSVCTYTNTRTHTHTHSGPPNTLPARPGFCPFFSPSIQSCRELGPQAQRSQPTPHTAHHGVASPPESPGPRWQSGTGLSVLGRSLHKGNNWVISGTQALAFVSMQSGGRERGQMGTAAQGGEEAIPSKVKSQTIRQDTGHWLLLSGSRSHQGVGEHCSKSCAIFYPKIRVRCQI